MFLTGRPWTTSRTASSTILPHLCAGCRRRRRSSPARGAARRVADLLLDALVERVVECDAVAQPHEQHDAHVALPFLADGERLEHLGDLLDLPIDLRRADAHAAGIQHRVGAAVNDDAAVLASTRIVAVAPELGKRSK